MTKASEEARAAFSRLSRWHSVEIGCPQRSSEEAQRRDDPPGSSAAVLPRTPSPIQFAHGFLIAPSLLLVGSHLRLLDQTGNRLHLLSGPAGVGTTKFGDAIDAELLPHEFFAFDYRSFPEREADNPFLDVATQQINLERLLELSERRSSGAGSSPFQKDLSAVLWGTVAPDAD
jgi:hypothetical protein